MSEDYLDFVEVGFDLSVGTKARSPILQYSVGAKVKHAQSAASANYARIPKTIDLIVNSLK